MNGIIVIDKPQGMTSHDVVSFLRRKTGMKRIGHSGTLDPMATGVLPVFIGKATRIIEYATRPGDPEAKLYRCTMKLGIETDTQDIWGKPLDKSVATLWEPRAATSGEPDAELAALSAASVNTPVSKEMGVALPPGAIEIEKALKSFEGQGSQRPPMYSAVKVGGRKLYEYARKGVEVDEGLVRSRNIYIKRITVNIINIEAGEAVFDVLCSKGVYIRTICADAGRLLGCGAVMSGLVRLKSDGFAIENALPLDALRDDSVPLPPLLPMDAPLSWMPGAELSAEGAKAFVQGRSAVFSGFLSNSAHAKPCDSIEGGTNRGLDATPLSGADVEPTEGSGSDCSDKANEGANVRVYGPSGVFLGIGAYIGVAIKPVKVLV